MNLDRLNPDRLLEDAASRAGSTNLGEPTWQAGFDRVLDGLRNEARLHELGIDVAAEEITTYLANRAAIVAWRAAHPEVAGRAINRPIVIIGQPRTGTTILYDLLAQDPDLRAPLTWEVDRPVPPPRTASYTTDVRIAEVDAALAATNHLIPGFTDFHPLGATLAQECVRMTAGDFRSMIFTTVYRMPTYRHWLLHEAEMTPAYRWHCIYLQHLQSEHPARQWLLKSPAHLWHLPDLLAEYPDAVVIQTHRDPLKVVASVSALAAHLRQLASAETSIADAASQFADEIVLGLDRGLGARDDGTLAATTVIDVHFADFMKDPLGTIASIYEQAALDLAPSTETRMRAFLAAHPSDVGGGRYSFADTGLDADALRERTQSYIDRFGVLLEPVV